MKTQGRKGSVTHVEVHQITSCAFCVLLKQVIRCLSYWSFTKKQEERDSQSKGVVWPLTPWRRPCPCKAPTAEASWGCVLWDSCGWASGLLGSCQTPRIPSGDAGGFVMRWWKKLPGEAGVCTELCFTEGHSEGVSSSAELQANRVPEQDTRSEQWAGHCRSRLAELLGGGRVCISPLRPMGDSPTSNSKWPRDQVRRTFSQQSK